MKFVSEAFEKEISCSEKVTSNNKLTPKMVMELFENSWDVEKMNKLKTSPFGEGSGRPG